jgi:hypothetical protein
MKLKDCDCGDTPKVTYNLINNSEFAVSCSVCGNQTHTCNSLFEATSLWNQIYYCTLPTYYPNLCMKINEKFE